MASCSSFSSSSSSTFSSSSLTALPVSLPASTSSSFNPSIPLRLTNSFSQLPLPSDQLPRSIIKAWNNEVIQEWKNTCKTDYTATISSIRCLLADSKYSDYVLHIEKNELYH